MGTIDQSTSWERLAYQILIAVIIFIAIGLVTYIVMKLFG